MFVTTGAPAWSLAASAVESGEELQAGIDTRTAVLHAWGVTCTVAAWALPTTDAKFSGLCSEVSCGACISANSIHTSRFRFLNASRALAVDEVALV
jgi:hypothetical protein